MDPGHGAADVVVVTEGLDERDDLALVEDRDGDAEVGRWPMPPSDS